MLSTIKEAVNNLPSKPFSEFYQEFISHVEDELIEYDMKKANSSFHSIEDVTDIVRGINKLTEELT